MYKIYMIRAAAAFLFMLLLGGCSFISDPVLLMKTPMLSAEKETLSSIIHAGLPNGADLIRSNEETDTNLIHFVDLDGDKVNEAIVFYATPEQAVETHGMIFKLLNGTWTKQAVFDGEGKVLESLQFKDMNNDGKIDIIAGYSRGDESVANRLIVYTFTGNSVEKALLLDYTNFVVMDLNGDHKNDLTIISLKRNEYANVTTYQYDKGSFVEIDKLDLDPYVNNYYNIVAGKVYKDKEGNTKDGIVIDASVGGANASYSNIIVMDNDKLRSVFGDNASKTLKDLPIMSEDVNNDGIIEIGLLESPLGWDLFEPSEIPMFFSYYQWDGKEGLKFISQQYRDMKNGFELGFFPPEWHNKVTIDTKSIKNQYLRFIMIDTGKTVAEIKFFTLGDWEKQHEDWKYLYRTNDKVIGYKKYGDFEIDNSKKQLKNEVPPIERKEKISE